MVTSGPLYIVTQLAIGLPFCIFLPSRRQGMLPSLEKANWEAWKAAASKQWITIILLSALWPVMLLALAAASHTAQGYAKAQSACRASEWRVVVRRCFSSGPPN